MGGRGSSRFITILHRGGSPQFITTLHRGEGSTETPHLYYLINGRPLTTDKNIKVKSVNTVFGDVSETGTAIQVQDSSPQNVTDDVCDIDQQ